LIYHGIQQWLGVYFSTVFNLGQFFISLLITLTSLSGIFGEAIGGRLSDSLGRLKTLNLGIILMVLSIFLLMLRTNFMILVLIMMVWGLGWTFNHAGVSTLLTDLPKDFLNEAASLNSSVRFISGGLGAAISGVIMQSSFNLGFLTFGLSLILLTIFAKDLLVVR
jgi:predicted MFS family arabinose efflux permease